MIFKKEIKSSWCSQPLGKAVRMLQVLARKDYPDDSAKIIAMVAVDKDITEEEAGAMTLNDFTKAVADLQWVQEPLPKPRNKGARHNFTIDNKAYFIPNVNTMTVAQFIDVQTIVTRPNTNKEDRSVEFIATMLVPVGGKYNEGYDIEELRKKVEDVPYGAAVEAMAFFLNSLKRRLVQETKTARRMMKQKKIRKMIPAKEMKNLIQVLGG